MTNLQTVNEGIQTIIHVTLSKKISKHSGKFFANCGVAYEPRILKDEAFCNEMWLTSERYAKLRDNERILD